MQEIRADRHMNRLYVTFDVSEETDILEFVLELQENCFRLSPGFSCRFNLMGLALSTQDDQWMISCIENLMLEYGSGEIDRGVKEEKVYDLYAKPKRVYRRFDNLYPSHPIVN